MASIHKKGRPPGESAALPFVVFSVFSILACWSLNSRLGGSRATTVAMQQRSTAAAGAAAAAGTAAVHMQLKGSSSIQAGIQQQPAASEWDNHIIFNGQQGVLDECSTDSSEWSEGTWTGDSSDTAARGILQSRGYMLPHSKAVQRLIWEHQHPADCSTAKFLLYRHPRMGEGSHGVGSLLHLQTTALLLALNSGRVLAEIPGTYLTDHPYCGNRTTLDSCYFEPLTHCSITQEQIQSAHHLNGSAGSPDHALFQGDSFEALDSLGQFVSADKMLPQKSPLTHTVPKAFQAMLQGTGIPTKNAFYWWRSQAIAYIVRPNEQALTEIAVRKRDKLRGLPLAPGCISLYIRHGDKHTEHKTFNDSEYEAALVHLRQVDPSLTRQVLLSTEDPATVTYFTNATRNWSTSYVDMPRKPDRKKNNVVYMKEHGFAEEMLDGLLNLDLALQCDGFVSSINSNWARLIDELRSTTRCKAHAKYMDVGLRSPKGFFFWY